MILIPQTLSLVFLEYYDKPFIPCWQKNQRTLVSPHIKALHSQYNTLRCVTYYKQSYCKDIQIYIVLETHEEQPQEKYRSFRAEYCFAMSGLTKRTPPPTPTLWPRCYKDSDLVAINKYKCITATPTRGRRKKKGQLHEQLQSFLRYTQKQKGTKILEYIVRFFTSSSVKYFCSSQSREKLNSFEGKLLQIRFGKT